jgi:C_GCAxxG_C_C family probable redox protein
MDEITNRARELFTKSNCSQAVLAVYGPSLGVDESSCLRTASCFGAGMGRLGKTCGALTGGLIVLGLRHGKEMQDDPQAGRDSVYARVQKLVAEFEAKHGSSECRALTGCDMTTVEGRASFAARGLHVGLCTELVVSVVEMLKEE